MILDTMQTLPEAEVSLLEPARVECYVQATGWKQEPRLGRGKVVVYERPEVRSEQIRIPVSHQLADFNVVMAQTVTLIAHWEKRPALELLRELLLPPADLVTFIESGPALKGIDVSFEQGLRMLAGVRTTLLAVACSVKRSQRFHPRLSLADAERFLSHCRLVSTATPFAITVACPLDAVATSGDPSESPFTRRVTSLLMRSLHRLATAFAAGNPSLALATSEGEPVISANLCEGLLDLTPEGDASSLSVTARWARALPPPSDALPGSVCLRREDFPHLEFLVQSLRPSGEPQQALLGWVEALNGRPTIGGAVEGEVLLTVLDPEGETLRARAELNAVDYVAAADAHLRSLPVSLRGILRRGVRTHRIDAVADFSVYPRLAHHPASA
jgi:hypothetical protein